jgi:hypothetical protein
MDRRRFLLTSLAGALAAPLVAGAQQTRKAAKIGFLLGGTLSSPAIHIEPFKQTLQERGWIEGQNLKLEYRYAHGRYERLPALAREILDLGVDVIVAEGTPPFRRAITISRMTDHDPPDYVITIAGIRTQTRSGAAATGWGERRGAKTVPSRSSA